jgi:hypothetical protein
MTLLSSFLLINLHKPPICFILFCALYNLPRHFGKYILANKYISMEIHYLIPHYTLNASCIQFYSVFK